MKMKYAGVTFFAVWCISLLSGVAFGQHIVKHALVKPFKLANAEGKVLSGLVIKGDTADCIELRNCNNVTIMNCRFGFSTKNGISIYNCRNIKVINCFFEKLASGVYALESSNVKVVKNQFKNIQGPFPRGQMVQFDDVAGAGNQINCNTGENLPGESAPEDAINLYKSYGTVNSPIQVVGNRIRGGGPSKEGGGIMLGDNGGGYIVASNNILVDPGQYGIAIAGGSNIRILNNVVYARKQPFTNVGIYVWNQQAPSCSLNEVRGNKVKFVNAKGEANTGWNQGNCGEVAGWESNNWNADIAPSVLPRKLLTN